ncbi:hypothetical protein M3668_06485 [Rothia sp. P100]|uniref:hypothetical protein n=1 Tax=Rothia sp. P100 TaxID=2939578 RepID=UPI00204264A4|nr:hypothetical protein [Rothia sp. P100]MCM3510422.1 hypothetical protein [Rothia sp. P100]
MATTIKGLLPTGKAPSVLKAEILEMVKTNAPAPDLSAYATKTELSSISTIQEVSGAVDLSATGPAVKEFYTLASTTIAGKTYEPGVGVVCSRNSTGQWRCIEVRFTGKNANVQLQAVKLTVIPTADGATITWVGVPGADSYVYRLDGGPWLVVDGASLILKNQAAASSHTVEVAAVSNGIVGSVAETRYRVAGSVQEVFHDTFTGANGVALTELRNSLTWSAPADATQIAGQIATLSGEAITSRDATWRGGRTRFIGEVLITFKYSRFARKGNFRFALGPKQFVVSSNGPTIGVDAPPPYKPFSGLIGNRGDVAVAILGGTATLWVDSVKVGDFTLGGNPEKFFEVLTNIGMAITDLHIQPYTGVELPQKLTLKGQKNPGETIFTDDFSVQGPLLGKGQWVSLQTNQGLVAVDGVLKPGGGYSCSAVFAGQENMEVSATLKSVPTGGNCVLFAHSPAIEDIAGVRLEITATTVTCVTPGSPDQALGAPVAGSTYYVRVINGRAEFRAISSAGGIVSKDAPFTGPLTMCAGVATNNGAGWTLDDFTVKGA